MAKKSKTKKVSKKKVKKNVLIVKRAGHEEKFDERKLYASCFFACRTTHMGVKESEKLCDLTCKDLRKIMKGKKKVGSNFIFKRSY